MSKKDYFNIKVTVYLSRKLESKIVECADKREKGFSDTIRYLIEKGLNADADNN